MSGPSQSESQSDVPIADQPHVSQGWQTSRPYEPYVHQPSMVAPGDVNTHHGPFPQYNFQGYSTPQQSIHADQQAAQFASNSSHSAYRTSYGPQQYAHFNDAEQMQQFQSHTPFYQHNSAFQQPQYVPTDLGQHIRGDIQQAHYPGFHFHPHSSSQPNFSCRNVDSTNSSEQDPVFQQMQQLQKANDELRASMAAMQSSLASCANSTSNHVLADGATLQPKQADANLRVNVSPGSSTPSPALRAARLTYSDARIPLLFSNGIITRRS